MCDQSFNKKDELKNYSQKLDKDFININNDDNNYNNYLNPSSQFGKKLSFSRPQPKTLDLLNKHFENNNFSGNNNNNTTNIRNNNFILHSLSKYKPNNKKNLLSKITEKVTKDFENNTNNKIHNKSKSNASSSKSSKNSIENKKSENSDKKESNEEEEEILLEQKDKMEDNIFNERKINSIQKYNNSFLRRRIYTGINFNYNTNTSNSNSTPKCNTEPNNQNLFKSGVYPNYTQNCRPYKTSFISTNPNSFNQSGHKIDSSLSSESPQSSNYFGNFHSFQKNLTINNCRNNNIILPFSPNVTPIGNKHIYNNSFSLNQNQAFNLNQKYQCKTEFNKFNNNFGQKNEKQKINLNNVALGKETRTTVMIRNIPIKYDMTSLLKELEPFEGKYNCLYIPNNTHGKEGNRGYAFLNLTSPYHILLLYDYFCNKDWLFYKSLKVCDFDYAYFQGIDEIESHAQNYKGNKKPIFFRSNPDNKNNSIEIPKKYLKLVLKANPKMKYHEIPFKNTFIVDSFN